MKWVKKMHRTEFPYNLWVLFILFAFMVLTGACKDTRNSDQTIKSLLDKKLSEKLAQFEKESIEACKKRALDSAVVIVDSIMRAEALLRTDTIVKPPRDERPQRPNVSFDTLDITPIKPFE